MPDCIVVGGGVIGLLSARQLHQCGMSVLIIERGDLGGESSWAGGGIISPLYPWRYSDAVNALAARSKQLYSGLAQALQDESGIDPELLTSGMLIVHDDEQQQAMAWSLRYGEAMRHVRGVDGLQALCPVLAESYDAALWLPAVQQVRNPKLVQALRGSCDVLGIACREHAGVDDIIIEDGRATGVQVGDEQLYADNIIVASGAWSGRLLDRHAGVDIEPVKGQMIMMQTKPGLVNTIVMDRGHYVIPRRDGHVLAGSTLEHTDFDKSVSDQAGSDLYEQACDLVPALQGYPVIRHWAGLRPGTKQGIPYICEHAEIAGLYIHAGHYRNGIVLGAASAELLAQLVSGQKPACDPAPYGMDSAH